MIKLNDKLFISPSIIIIFIGFSFLDGFFAVLLIFLSALLHELGHLGAIKLLKIEILSIKILTFGASIEIKDGKKTSYKNELFIALAGPLINLFLCGLGIMFQVFFGIYNPVSLLCLINALLFLLNILPIMPLDGGRALYALLLMRINIVKAVFISDLISLITLTFIILFSFYILFLSGYNFSLLLISVYLLIVFLVKTRGQA